MNSLIAPPYLRSGDTIAVVAPASKVSLASIENAIAWMEQEWGVTVLIGESVGASDFTFSGSDDVRRRDFQRMLDDPAVRAIFAARGGYGSSRIVDELDFTRFMQSPKWVVGFSDITVIHGKIQHLGYQSIHGPMLKTIFWDAISDEYLWKALNGEYIDYQTDAHPKNRTGEAVGQLIGGNLALLAHDIGSGSDLDYEGKILFLEDVGEYYYNLDRMLWQLQRAGKLTHLAGLVVGQFNDLKDNSEPFGMDAYDIIQSHIGRYNYPVAYNFPIGHTTRNWAVRCGELMQLNVTPTTSVLQGFLLS